MLKKNINFRLAIVCIAAASVGLSMALISIAKLLLLLCGLATLMLALRAPRSRPPACPAALAGKATPIAILAALAAFALSLLWTVAPEAEALGSLAKYGKLLAVIFLLGLLRDRREALYALAWYAGAQIFLVLSSWALFVHLPVPWATSNMALREFAVFSSYLDQGIMGAVLAAVCWHLRGLVPGRYGRQLAMAAAVLAVSNVLFVLSGRSGHVAAIALLSLAIMWELPRRFRPVVVLLPFVLALALFASSHKVRDRLTKVGTEVQDYSTEVQPTTSSGIRLGLWRRAVQMMEQHPAIGLGVGGWSSEYNRLERADNPAHVDIHPMGNPHQEYLQWGLQLGLPGLLLFIGLLLSVLRDTLAMEAAAARAAQSALAALAVACLFNSSLYDALIGDFFCVTLGLLLALGSYPAEPSKS